MSGIPEEERIERHIPKPPAGVDLGVTHLWYNGDFRKLNKCPFCNFKNIFESEIEHHIRFTDDYLHKEGKQLDIR